MWWKEIKKITIASLITLAAYLLTELPLRLIVNTVDSAVLSIIELLLCFVISFVFVYVYIWRYFLKGKTGENEIWREQRDLAEPHLDNSIKTIVAKQKMFIICLFTISALGWIVAGIDSVIFEKLTISRVLILYSPIYMYVEVLPAFLAHILGFVVGPAVATAFYVLLLKKYRKQWYDTFISSKEGERNER